MSESAVAAPGSAQQPQGIITPVVAAPAAPIAQADDQNPGWLAARLDRERRTFLNGLGFKDEADAKAAHEAATAAANAKKTSEEREAARIAELAALSAKTTALETTIAERANRELATLTPHQRAAVEAIAGTDKAAQLRAIDALAPTWGAAPATASAAPAAPIPAPGASAPTVTAPPAPSQTPQSNHLATYQDLQNRNPVAAASYFLANHDAISKAQTPRA